MFKKKNLIKNAKHIFCISNQTKRDLIKYYKVKKKKISVVYLGVDQKKYLKKNKKNYILFVGSRVRYKNFNNLLKAFSKSKYLLKNYKILCFGDKKFNNSEIYQFNKLKIEKKIFFESGNDSELNKVYSNASIFVNPSFFEGFGLTNLEAMKNGCPVICSNIPVFKEILGKSVEYFNPKNVGDIKNKLEKILKSKKKKIGLIKNGFEKIRQYNWDKCAYKTSEVYKKIIY
jgi:glycosyltransferase involved in cell wall biosynthesis